MITVKLYSAIRKYGGKVVMFDYVEGLTVKDIIEKLKIPLIEISIIILDDYDSTTDIMINREVNESSLIHLFPPMAGG